MPAERDMTFAAIDRIVRIDCRVAAVVAGALSPGRPAAAPATSSLMPATRKAAE